MDFKGAIEMLERRGKVVHVKSEVDPVHELAGIAKKFEGSERVVLFERVKGRRHPVVCGLWWNREIIGSLFGVSAGGVPELFAAAGARFRQNPVPPVVVEDPPCQEVESPEPDLGELTIPTLALGDGGAYFSNCVVIAKDPDTGVRNTSIHRLMITGKKEVSGFYAKRDDRWVVEVLAVTHRRNPLMSTLLPGKEVWNSVGCTAEAAE